MDIFSSLPRRTSYLIGGLALVTAFFLYLALTTNPPQPIVKKLPPVPTPTPFAQTVLSLDLQPASASSKIRTVSVGINTKIDHVNAVQLEIDYDPTLLTSITATPGSFFTDPVILFKEINTTAGHISYAIALSPTAKSIMGTGEVARISFLPSTATTSANTTMTVTPKTLVTADGVLQSVLSNLPSVEIPLTAPTSSVIPAPRIITTPINTPLKQ